jgi:hypothetical protein
MFRLIMFLFVLCLTAQSPVNAQPGPDLNLLREQLQALQAQIDAATEQSSKRTNVTQIGGSRQRMRDGGLVIRIYDLGDLFAVAPPYAALVEGDLTKSPRGIFSSEGSYQGGRGVGGGGFGGGGVFNIGPRNLRGPTNGQHVANQVSGGGDSIRTSQDALIKTIKQTISPDVWDEAGGEATIAKLGNAFIISADEETHSQIDALLNLFRQRWGTLRTISVRAWWHWMTPAEAAPVLNSDGEPVHPGDAPAFGLVPDDAWMKILEAWSEAEGDRPRGFQATLTCYNGQTVHTTSGDQSLAVTGIRPIIARDENDEKVGRIAYRPELSVVHEGLAFQITPISNLSGETVLLDLHSRITMPIEKVEMLQEVAEQVGGEPLPKQVVEVLDRRRMNVHRLSTTLRVPTNRPMLVGGMSAAGTSDGAGHNLYLFVKLSVQELRNDREEPEPAPVPPEHAPAPPVPAPAPPVPAPAPGGSQVLKPQR